MTESVRPSVLATSSPIIEAPPSLLDILLYAIAFLRQNSRILWVSVAAAVAVGNVYLLVVQPTYLATASLILDMRNVNFSQQKSMVSDIALDSAFVESQVEVLKASNVLFPVIDKLKLASDPEFVRSTGGKLGDVVQAVREWLGIKQELSDAELKERAFNALLRNISVKRVGLSFVIEVSYRSGNAERAAQIDNAIAESYLAEQASAKIYAARRATQWLEESLAGLRDQMLKADRAVVEFKEQNEIVDVGGRLIKDQQLSDLNSQLVAAMGKVFDARARLNRIATVLENLKSEFGPVDATVTDTLKSEVISKLRSQYLDLAGREADWSRRYGPDHLAAENLRNNMREIRFSIIDELRRIAESTKSDYEIARRREHDIQEKLAQAIASSETKNQAQITLRELESTANGYRTMYEEFLKRHLETMQQQTFPMVDGRVISPAAVPLRVSSPRASTVIVISVALGLALGFGIVLLRELRSAMAAYKPHSNPRAA